MLLQSEYLLLQQRPRICQLGMQLAGRLTVCDVAAPFEILTVVHAAVGLHRQRICQRLAVQLGVQLKMRVWFWVLTTGEAAVGV